MQFVLSHPDLNTSFVREAGTALREAGWRCRAVTACAFGLARSDP